MPTQNVRVNSRELDWNSLIFKIGGERNESITSIAWAEKRDRPLGWSNRRSGKPGRRANGKYDPGTIKVTMYESDWLVWMAQLALQSGQGSYGDAYFEMSLQLVEPGLPVKNTLFEDCCIISPSESYSEGTDPAKVDLEISTMGISTNGFTLYRKI